MECEREGGKWVKKSLIERKKERKKLKRTDKHLMNIDMTQEREDICDLRH